MLKICIFNEPVIPCGTLERLISCLTPIDVTQLYLLWVPSFNVTFLMLDGGLQPYRLVHVYVPKVCTR